MSGALAGGTASVSRRLIKTRADSSPFHGFSRAASDLPRESISLSSDRARERPAGPSRNIDLPREVDRTTRVHRTRRRVSIGRLLRGAFKRSASIGAPLPPCSPLSISPARANFPSAVFSMIKELRVWIKKHSPDRRPAPSISHDDPLTISRRWLDTHTHTRAHIHARTRGAKKNARALLTHNIL